MKQTSSLTRSLARAQEGMTVYKLYWSPEGREIATVRARTMRAAIRKAPYPYRRYLGEIYALSQEN